MFNESGVCSLPFHTGTGPAAGWVTSPGDSGEKGPGPAPTLPAVSGISCTLTGLGSSPACPRCSVKSPHPGQNQTTITLFIKLPAVHLVDFECELD